MELHVVDQAVMNWILSAAGAILGFFLTILWQTVKDLQHADMLLAEKVSKVEILVAGQYVSKDEFLQFSMTIFKKLDRIEDSIANKADKN